MKSQNSIILILCMSLFFFIQCKSTEKKSIVEGQYILEQFIENGDTLNYQIMYPHDFDVEKKYPLLLFLHGMGERGNDNRKQLTHGSKLFKDSLQKYPAIVVFPQCPVTDYWANLSRPDEGGRDRTFEYHTDLSPNPTMSMAIKLTEGLLEESFIDQSRFYVSGLSMGGFGTWELLWRMPEKIAASAPICAGAPLEMASKMTKVPIWTFHGLDDSVVNPQFTIDIHEAIQALGGDCKISLYPGVDHDSWTNAFAEQTFLSWMFSKTKT